MKSKKTKNFGSGLGWFASLFYPDQLAWRLIIRTDFAIFLVSHRIGAEYEALLAVSQECFFASGQKYVNTFGGMTIPPMR